jgi:hypothetical protein
VVQIARLKTNTILPLPFIVLPFLSFFVLSLAAVFSTWTAIAFADVVSTWTAIALAAVVSTWTAVSRAAVFVASFTIEFVSPYS